MTYGPPPDQPPEPGGQHGAGGYGPPPGAGYGPKPGYGQPAGGPPAGGAGGKAAGAVSAVSPLDWALIAGGVIALIFSFFQYYTAEFTDRIKEQVCNRTDIPSSVRVGCDGDSASAWHGFFGWFGVVLLLVA